MHAPACQLLCVSLCSMSEWFYCCTIVQVVKAVKGNTVEEFPWHMDVSVGEGGQRADGSQSVITSNTQKVLKATDAFVQITLRLNGESLWPPVTATRILSHSRCCAAWSHPSVYSEFLLFHWSLGLLWPYRPFFPLQRLCYSLFASSGAWLSPSTPPKPQSRYFLYLLYFVYFIHIHVY